MAKRNHKMPYYGPQNVPGQIARGNVDLANRPKVRNADGSVSTVMSFSVGADDGAVLLPQVLPNGTMPSIEEALKFGKKSRQNLGFFDSNDSADAYAEALHNEQAKQYPSEQNAGSFYSPKNVGRPGSLGLLEALKMAQDRYAAEQAGKPPAAPFNLQQTLQGADKAIQQGVFGAVDAIGSEGKRLIDGKFGFDALSQALPQLAQSGPQNLAEALATTRQGGAQWTNQDLQAQRDRDNLGKAGGGAMDATWLLPAVPAAKAGVKAGGEGLAEMLARRVPEFEANAWKANELNAANSAPFEWIDPPGQARKEFEWLSSPEAAKYRDGLERTGHTPQEIETKMRRMARASNPVDHTAAPDVIPGFSGNPTITPTLQKYMDALKGQKAEGPPNRTIGGSVPLSDLPKTPEMKKYLKARDEQRNPQSPNATVLPFGKPPSGSPTTLSAGFGFGGKDGEKPLWDSLRDVFKGKQAPAADPLDQFTPPTSLDDIFTGAPRSPRADTGPLDPRQPEGPAFNASTPEVGYDGQGFTGLDAQFTQAKNRNTLAEALAKREQKPLDPDLLSLLAAYGGTAGMGSALWARQAHQPQPGM